VPWDSRGSNCRDPTGMAVYDVALNVPAMSGVRHKVMWIKALVQQPD